MRKFSFGGKLFLTASGIAAAAVLFVFGVAYAPQLRAQSTQADGASSPSTLPSFEVASVKRHAGEEGMIHLDGPDPSRYTVSNMSVKIMIEFAYGMKDFQISGGPSWIESERFDIDAKVEDSIAEQLRKLSREQQQAQKNLMVRSLLADRFELKVTHEAKELPVYALVVAKNGPKLAEVAPPGPLSVSQIPPPARGSGPPPLLLGTWRMSINNGQVTIEAKAEPLPRLVDLLSQQRGRIVLDQTGLKGSYDFTLQYALETGPEGGAPPPSMEGGTTTDTGPLFSAIQEQLGLKLESTKAPVDTIMIDHIEEPTPN